MKRQERSPEIGCRSPKSRRHRTRSRSPEIKSERRKRRPGAVSVATVSHANAKKPATERKILKAKRKGNDAASGFLPRNPYAPNPNKRNASPTLSEKTKSRRHSGRKSDDTSVEATFEDSLPREQFLSSRADDDIDEEIVAKMRLMFLG